MEDLKYIKDDSGRIVKAIRGDKQANIVWFDNSADVEYVNAVLMILFSQRDVGGDVGG